MGKNKRERQAALRELIREQPIANQSELVQALGERGFGVTQAGVSRDVRELGLIKLNGRYQAVDRPSVVLAGPDASIEDGLIVGGEPAGANLIVVRTAPGAAGAVGLRLDRSGGADVVGTIAGDDTVFVAVRSRAAQGRVLARIRNGPGARPDSSAV